MTSATKSSLLFLDTGADLEALEAQYPGAGGREQLLDGLVRVLDERLAEQR